MKKSHTANKPSKLIKAITTNKETAAIKLIKQQMDFTKPCKHSKYPNTPPFILAAKFGFTKLMRVMVAQTAKKQEFINQEINGKTALIISIENNHLKAAIYLITNGADYSNHSCTDFKTLLFAVSQGKPDIVACLIKQAEKDIKNQKIKFNTLADFVNDTITSQDDIFFGTNALYLAAEKGFFEIVKLLVHAGSDWKKPLINGGEAGLSPLHVACENIHYEIVAYFLTLEPKNNMAVLSSPVHMGTLKDFFLLDVLLENKKGNKNDKEKLLALLIKHGAKCNQQTLTLAIKLKLSNTSIKLLFACKQLNLPGKYLNAQKQINSEYFTTSVGTNDYLDDSDSNSTSSSGTEEYDSADEMFEQTCHKLTTNDIISFIELNRPDLAITAINSGVEFKQIVNCNGLDQLTPFAAAIHCNQFTLIQHMLNNLGNEATPLEFINNAKMSGISGSNTALEVALGETNTKIINFLLDKGATVSPRTFEIALLLSSSLEVMKRLVQSLRLAGSMKICKILHSIRSAKKLACQTELLEFSNKTISTWELLSAKTTLAPISTTKRNTSTKIIASIDEICNLKVIKFETQAPTLRLDNLQILFHASQCLGNYSKLTIENFTFHKKDMMLFLAALPHTSLRSLVLSQITSHQASKLLAALEVNISMVSLEIKVQSFSAILESALLKLLKNNHHLMTIRITFYGNVNAPTLNSIALETNCCANKNLQRLRFFNFSHYKKKFNRILPPDSKHQGDQSAINYLFLQYAEKNNQFDLMLRLTSLGIDMNKKNGKGHTLMEQLRLNNNIIRPHTTAERLLNLSVFYLNTIWQAFRDCNDKLFLYLLTGNTTVINYDNSLVHIDYTHIKAAIIKSIPDKSKMIVESHDQGILADKNTINTHQLTKIVKHYLSQLLQCQRNAKTTFTSIVLKELTKPHDTGIPLPISQSETIDKTQAQADTNTLAAIRRRNEKHQKRVLQQRAQYKEQTRREAYSKPLFIQSAVGKIPGDNFTPSPSPALYSVLPSSSSPSSNTSTASYILSTPPSASISASSPSARRSSAPTGSEIASAITQHFTQHTSVIQLNPAMVTAITTIHEAITSLTAQPAMTFKNTEIFDAALTKPIIIGKQFDLLIQENPDIIHYFTNTQEKKTFLNFLQQCNTFYRNKTESNTPGLLATQHSLAMDLITELNSWLKLTTELAVTFGVELTSTNKPPTFRI